MKGVDSPFYYLSRECAISFGEESVPHLQIGPLVSPQHPLPLHTAATWVRTIKPVGRLRKGKLALPRAPVVSAHHPRRMNTRNTDGLYVLDSAKMRVLENVGNIRQTPTLSCQLMR